MKPGRATAQPGIATGAARQGSRAATRTAALQSKALATRDERMGRSATPISRRRVCGRIHIRQPTHMGSRHPPGRVQPHTAAAGKKCLICVSSVFRFSPSLRPQPPFQHTRKGASRPTHARRHRTCSQSHYGTQSTRARWNQGIFTSRAPTSLNPEQQRERIGVGTSQQGGESAAPTHTAGHFRCVTHVSRCGTG